MSSCDANSRSNTPLISGVISVPSPRKDRYMAVSHARNLRNASTSLTDGALPLRRYASNDRANASCPSTVARSPNASISAS